MSSGLYHIEKLDDENYDGWQVQMRSVLVHCDLWGYVSEKVVCPPASDEAALAAHKLKIEKALATIMLSVKTSQLLHIKHSKTAAEAWKKLEDVHRPAGPASKVTIFKQLTNLKMAEGSSLSSHLGLFFGLCEKMNVIDIKIPDELMSIILLSSLPKSYENFVVAIESRDELPKVQVLKTKLLEEGNRRESNVTVQHDGEAAFFSKQQQQKQHKSQHHGKPQHHQHHQQHQRQQQSSQQQQTSQQTTQQQTRGKCYKCQKHGHYAAECNSSSKRFSAAYAMLNSVGFADLKRHMWVLDSGTTCHMCCDKAMFNNISPHREKIQLAGDNYIYSESIGDVTIKTETTDIQLKRVLYVPTLNTNFMSMSKATQYNYTVQFDNNNATITNNTGVIIMRAEKRGSLYVYTSEIEHLYNANTNDEFLTWHARYGHLNAKSLCKLMQNDLVRGIDVKNCQRTIECDVCIRAKMCSLPFGQKHSISSDAVLDIVHSDICGPMRTTSLGGCRFFVLFIDDHSRKMFVQFLKHKSDVFDAFKLFKSRVERETGRKIKTLRTDNGCEYLSSQFSGFLDSEGIKRQLTVQYTPQQNGVAERANRTIVEMARCMLISSKLPESLWAEAVNTAVYLRNRSPTSLLMKTPYEMWSGVKPAVYHLRIFGCRAFALDKRPGKSKFAAKSVECTMVGYSPESKAYRLYVKTSRKIIKSRDVKFFENSGLNGDIGDYTFFESLTIDEPARKAPPAIKSDLESDDESEFDDAVGEAGDSSSGRKDGSGVGGTSGSVVGNDNRAIIEADRSEDAANGVSSKRNRLTSSTSTHAMNLRDRPNALFMIGECVSNPITVNDALSSRDKDRWFESMQAEYDALMENETWDLVELPAGRRPIQCKWVFNIKRDKRGNIERFKSRLVAKGCSQRYGVDYTETFSPVVRYSSLRLVLALAVEYNLHIHQMDVATAYLNGILNEDVYMKQPDMFISTKNENKVCKLKKALYGLKQSGREWNHKLDQVLTSIGFKPCHADTCVYTMNVGKQINIVLVYVDDILLACSSVNDLLIYKQKISDHFDVVDKGPVDFFLGMEIQCENGVTSVSHKHYIEELLAEHGMLDTRKCYTPLDPGQKFQRCDDCSNCVLVDTKSYQSLIGSLMYLGISTRPDIIHSVSKLAQFNIKPHAEHMTAAKHLLRYLNNTVNFKITYRKTGENVLAFADADWAGSCDDRKSYTGYTLMLAGASVSWESCKQQTVALSSTEAEYMALSSASKEIVYVRNFLAELGFQKFVDKPTVLNGDNLSSMQLVKNPVYHAKSKHIDIRVHYIREVYKSKLIILNYVPTDENIADVFTKNLNKAKHTYLTRMLGIS